MSERTGAHQQLAPRDFSIVFHGVGKRLSLNDSSDQTRAAEPRESAFLHWPSKQTPLRMSLDTVVEKDSEAHFDATIIGRIPG
jgi:hypothetical protein